MSKNSGNGVTPTAVGPTITKNSPANFKNHGVWDSPNPAAPVAHAVGPTFNVNSTLIKTPNADKPAPTSKSKSTSKMESPHAPGYAKNASDVGTSAGQPHGCLASSYGK